MFVRVFVKHHLAAWLVVFAVSCAPRLLAQCEIAKVVPADGVAGDLFGYSATMTGSDMFVGAFLADDQEQNSGAVYVVDPRGIQEEINPPFGRGFGESVSVDGGRLLVGGTSGGYAFIVEPSEIGAWTITAQLHSEDWQSGDAFGSAVSLDGNAAVVGAYDDSNQNGSEAGSAYVFARDPNGVWTQAQKLLASDGLPGAEFGDAVAIDGDVLVVGAPSQWMGEFAWAGKAYVFERSAQTGAWVETARLLPPLSHTYQNFGCSVAVEDDVVIIGALADYASEPSGGAAYIYERDADGTWSLIAQLVPADPQNSQFFGSAVGIDDSRIIVGAPGDNNPQVSNGAAYVFLREADGVWHQHAKYTASDGQTRDEFGWSVALDGSWALIGARYDDDNGSDSGSAYIFRVGPDWSGNGVPDICECPGDIDYSGAVGLSDLSALLTNFGLAAGQSYESGDIDGDYDVDLADLSALLERYGTACP